MMNGGKLKRKLLKYSLKSKLELKQPTKKLMILKFIRKPQQVLLKCLVELAPLPKRLAKKLKLKWMKLV